ncbi:MAG: regulatory iron-sulfur-containing complex subunit RicT, partial [Calditrichaceae bacterium]
VHYFNPKDIKIKPGDYVIVEAEKGVDLGLVSKIGRLVTLNVIKGEPKNLIRLAEDEDLQKLKDNRLKEAKAFMVCREKIVIHNLNMKLVDVEYQYDQNKLTFYFTSEKRIDFRELVKDLAGKYKTRIEMRQIGVRDEARRMGGLGICGEPLCCSLFMREFEPISTQYAKDQHLPLNPCKLTGVCGRLKCCLLYENGFYETTLKKFPPLDKIVYTSKGKAIIEKVDIFRDVIYLRYPDEDETECMSRKEYNQICSKKMAQA